jgi:hypothetical protein
MNKRVLYSRWDRIIISVLCVIVSGFSFKHAYQVHTGEALVSTDECSRKGRLFCHIGNLIFEQFGNDGVAAIYLTAGLLLIGIVNVILRRPE